MGARVRSLLSNLILAAASVAASLGLGEVIVRWYRPQPLQALHVWPDGTLRHRPGFRYTYTRAEFSNRIAWNAIGMRGPDVPPRDDVAVPRAVFLGDSFVEGKQVGDEEVLTAVMRRVSAERGRPIEVINLGVSGIGTAMEIALWDRLARDLRPDLVLLGFYPNDVRNNAEPGDFTIRDGKVEITIAPPRERRFGFVRDARSWLAAHSHLFILFRSGRVALRDRMEPPEATEAEDVFAIAPGEEVRRGWEMTGHLLDAIADRVDEAGARLVLVGIPARFQVDDALWHAFAARAGLEEDRFDRRLPERRLGEWAQRRGVAYVPLLDALRASNVDNSFYYDGDGHFNAAGHDLAARVILDAIEDLAYADAPVSPAGDLPASPPDALPTRTWAARSTVSSSR